MQRRGILRFLGILFICIFILFYNGSKIIKSFVQIEIIPENTETPLFNEGYIYEIENESEENTEEPSEPSETEKKDEDIKESVQTSAGAVKGKIISSYISPYEGSNSYSGVYLKNSTSQKINLKSFL